MQAGNSWSTPPMGLDVCRNDDGCCATDECWSGLGAAPDPARLAAEPSAGPSKSLTKQHGVQAVDSLVRAATGPWYVLGWRRLLRA